MNLYNTLMTKAVRTMKPDLSIDETSTAFSGFTHRS
jgi:hypothetical protein